MGIKMPLKNFLHTDQNGKSRSGFKLMGEGLKLELRESLSPVRSQEVRAPTGRHFPGAVPELEVSPAGIQLRGRRMHKHCQRLQGLAGTLRAYNTKAGGPPGVRSCLERQEERRKREDGRKINEEEGLEPEGQRSPRCLPSRAAQARW